MTDPTLTAEGCQRLAERAARLRDEVLPELLEAFADPQRDAGVVLDYERTLGDLHRLEALLPTTVGPQDRSDNPYVVELGDLVTLEIDSAEIERFLVVDPGEAAEDELRMSALSPLGTAIMGQRVGAEVEVTGPAGSYRCRVLGATRPAAD